ncbi:hypothetical protein J5Y09_06395 [Roseomonas sp. PWR1]|uniref:Uncharacterized protein n=1 Tax=Roseomonas nitratireducens TaxID=2820810 RepID=A0ABS4AQ90_9PROT|nr:hypothetical protein [Neoroseomonas nitratireducens]MBP0463532.1 hypothetical protein [Neoroseomonas nitratireducens]
MGPMRMAHTITLVLLGGGVMLGGAAMMMPSPGAARQRECQEARAQARPDADQICASARSSSTRTGGSMFYAGGGTGSRGPALAGAAGFRGDPSASSRGGFGGIGRAFSSSSGG